MKILSWNVNGIRAAIKKGFQDFLKKEKPDILCLQEIKISESTRKDEQFDFPNYNEYWNSAERPGYSGTALLVKSKKLNVESIHNGFGVDEFDKEGRVQTLDLGSPFLRGKGFYLVNVYFPNANHELSRLQYKLEFNNILLKHLKKLEKKKPVIVCGDFNVAHQEIDLARPKDNVGNPGFTYEEREWMDKFLQAGFIDTFRHQHPKKQEYSWWSYRFNARARNIGWRIDYFCVSAKIVKNVKKSFILNNVLGSDHCPVGIDILD